MPTRAPAEDSALDSLVTQQLLRWIDELTPAQGTVVLLRLISDLPVAEVARIVGKREGAVKALHRRGLLALRKRIEAQGVSEIDPPTFTPVI